MNDIKDLFLKKDLRRGGFFELSIQVCPSAITAPIERYTEFIQSSEQVDGPYNNQFEIIKLNLEHSDHDWVLNLGHVSIPFRTINIREEEPRQNAFNWFLLVFYTATIEEVFGEEYRVWVENARYPEQLIDFLESTLIQLNQIYPFQLAIIDFEVSGLHYLSDLKNELSCWSNTKFYDNKKDENQLSRKNLEKVNLI